MPSIRNLKETRNMLHKEDVVRKCLHCNHIIRGRADKKFCDDSCRSAYNNHKVKKPNMAQTRMNTVVRILEKVFKTIKSLFR